MSHFNDIWKTMLRLICHISMTLEKLCCGLFVTFQWHLSGPFFEASDWSKVGDLARRRGTSNDIARLLLMVPLEPWRNSTPFFGAPAFCTTKIDDSRSSSTLSSLTTWLRRPLRKNQLGGTAAAFCTTKNDDFRASSTLSSLTTWLRRPLRKDQLRGTKRRYSPYI